MLGVGYSYYGPGLVYAGSRVQIVWVGQGGPGPVYVGCMVRIVCVVQSGLQWDMLGCWVGCVFCGWVGRVV